MVLRWSDPLWLDRQLLVLLMFAVAIKIMLNIANIN